MHEHLRAVIKKLHPVDSGYALMRIGYPHDGGYLIPDALNGIKYCFSPGVSGETELEDQLVEKGMECFLLDGSVDSPKFKHPEHIHFEKMYLKKEDSANSWSLDTWKKKSIADYKGDLFLQMDIEGYEYEVLDSVSEELLSQFRIMVVEFHELQAIANGTWLNIFDKICNQFHVVHLHPNNFHLKSSNAIVGDLEIPRVMEMTFMRKDGISTSHPLPVANFPHPLDIPNNPNYPALDLPECWYK